MTKLEREIRDLVKQCGFSMLGMSQNGHIKARLARPDGSVVTSIFPSSPGDHRWVKNKRKELELLMRSTGASSSRCLARLAA